MRINTPSPPQISEIQRPSAVPFPGPTKDFPLTRILPRGITVSDTKIGL